MNPLSKSKISDIATSYAGGTPKRTVAGYYNGTIPWVKSGEINSVNIFSSEEKITDEGLRNSSAKLVEPGAILVAMYGATAGKVGRLHIEATTNQAVLSVRSKNSNVISNDYLFWLLTFASEELIKQCQGAAQPNLSKQLIDGYQILYPSITEQQKIAEVLSTVDNKIDLIDQKIAETEKLKTGLMQKLFSEGVGVQDENGEWQPHTEFQDNGLPMHWGFLKLGSVAKVTSGGTPSRKKASFWDNGTIPWITTGEVNFNCITNSSQKITDEGLKNSAAKMFPPDTILMAMYGQGQTRGRVAMLGIEASTNQACAAIICSKKLNPHFCYHYLSSQYEKIRAIGNEGSQKNLNGQIIKDILIPCPNLEEQEQIALVLSTVDEKITLLAKQKSETQQLKKGLMQKLLTGEWRVPVEETEAA